MPMTMNEMLGSDDEEIEVSDIDVFLSYDTFNKNTLPSFQHQEIAKAVEHYLSLFNIKLLMNEEGQPCKELRIIRNMIADNGQQEFSMMLVFDKSREIDYVI